MEYIYELTHELCTGEYDYVTDIAIYSTREKAEKALEKFKKLDKFKNHTEGFNIAKYKIDKDNWTEGFFTYNG